MKHSNSGLLPVIRILLVLFLVVIGLHYARAFLIPLAIASLLAALFFPFCSWLESKKISRILAALMCILIFLLATSGIFIVIGWQIAELSKDFEIIAQQASDAIIKLQEFIYSHLHISVVRQDEMMDEQKSGFGSILSLIAQSLTNVFTGFILMLVYVVLLLYYRTHLKDFFLMLVPASKRMEVNTLIRNATEVSHQYLLGLTKMIVCLWIMYGIGFYLIGVKNPFFFAVLCGILEIVPFVGNITGTTITVLVSSIHGASLGMLGGIVLIYAIVQFIQGWVLEPLVVGPHVKINAFATIVSLVIGNLIWGIPGIMLAIPLTGILKIACDYIEPLKPYGFLIGGGKDEKQSRGRKFFFRGR